jgi:hypothetical protein
MATVGKAIYFDNPRRLSMMVGDKGLQNITITEDHMMQDNRIFINRSETREGGIAAGNQLLFTLVQAGMIDDIRFSNLFGRANSEQIARALREFAREKLQAKSAQDKATAQQGQMAQEQNQQMADAAIQQQQEQGAAEQVDGQLAHERELEKIALKGEVSNNRSNVPN